MVEQNASLSSAFLRNCRSERSEESASQANGQRPTTNSFIFSLPRDAAHDQWAAEQLDHLGIEDFCLLNAGAGWGAKIWPAERWAEVARALAAQGMPSIINYGPGEEALARRVESDCQGAAFAISSSIGQLIALTRRARLCVGGDTGPTHLAAALGLPIVAIYGPTDPARNGPFAPSGSRAQIIVLRSETSVTDHARRTEPEPGLLQISPQHVVSAALRVLEVGNHW
jgi:heptosyltransferase-1